MKAPNGYGSVVKLAGNRRNPYAVRKTTGWNEKGHPIYLAVGYCPTREAGMLMLANYNNDPWDVDKAKITFEELFDLWVEKKLSKLSASNAASLKSAKNHCYKLFNMKYKQVRSYHMQDIIDNCGLGYSTQGAIKNLFGHLDRFAFELDITNKCYSDVLTSAPIPETSKQPFTDEEVAAVWRIETSPWVDSVLVFLYSGFRLSELLSIKSKDVDIDTGIMKGGTKTAAGKNRIVPIHSKIHHLIEKRLSEKNEYLFGYNGGKCNANQYYDIWGGIMKQLNIKHTPHECRHTFRSRLDAAGANKVCIDMMMGHKSKEVGERVYTHKTIQDLKEAVELIENSK